MSGKFEIKSSSNGQYFFNLKAGNGQVILSGGMSKEKSKSLSDIEAIKTNAPLDERYERKLSSKEEPYFVLKASDGDTLGKSEMYSSSTSMENGIASVKTNAPTAPITDLSI
jgi:uncharacterized protein